MDVVQLQPDGPVAWAAAAGRLARRLDPRVSFLPEPSGSAPEEGPRGVVLVGQRAAGKSTLLPLIAEMLGREAIDLDRAIEARAGSSIGSLFARGEEVFRALEAETFGSLPLDAVVAVGGGFHEHHRSRLAGRYLVRIPVSFETYAERLRADTTRPRLRREISLEEELREVFERRERQFREATELHRLEDLLRVAPLRRTARVVTLPPASTGEAARAFALEARARGADLLEIRTDLHRPDSLDAGRLAEVLELLISERGAPIPEAWRRVAAWADRPLGESRLDGPLPLASLHAEHPLRPEEAVELWRSNPLPYTKHVEPLGRPETAARLFETQRLLARRTAAGTVLATGPEALPFRALLARENLFDYLALASQWQAAPGQRLLVDAVRERRKRPARRRLGILGNPVGHSCSPAIHPWPFDRIELPPETELGPLLAALHEHYAGFAVTSPFKGAVARAIGAGRAAINTLVRTPEGWEGHNTDVDGAMAILPRFDPGPVTLLGGGGASDALREACDARGVAHRTLRRDELDGTPLRGLVLWTWPAQLEPPRGLRFEAARVGVIAYGSGARRLARTIEERGGVPVLVGAKWFVAQARRQRALWEKLL